MKVSIHVEGVTIKTQATTKTDVHIYPDKGYLIWIKTVTFGHLKKCCKTNKLQRKCS